MKKLAVALAFFLFCVPKSAAPIAHAQQVAPPPPPQTFPTPPEDDEALWKSTTGTRIVVFKILPGQALKLFDPYYDFVKIESRFPVAVYVGKCRYDRTVEADCRDIAPNAEILIYDSRVGISPDISPRNGIKITAVKH